MTESTATVRGGVALAPAPARRDAARRAPSELVTSRRLAWAAMLGLVGGGVATVLCSSHTGTLSPDSIRLAPQASRIITGDLSSVGPDIHLGGVIALFTLMCVCYATLVRLGHELHARVIVVAVIALEMLTVFAPPLLSTDVFSYGAYARMGDVYKINPYDLGPHAIMGDSWFPFVGARWAYTPSAYGPLFTGISYLLAHLSISAATLAYKLMAVACSLAAIAGVAKAAQRLGRDVTQAVLFVGLNPALIVYGVGGAHNDMLMLAALCWAVVALVAHRARTSGGLLVVAVAVKLTAGIMLPFALAARRGPTRIGGHQPRLLVGALLVLVGVGIISTVLFGSGPLHLLSTLELIQSNGGRQSIPGFIAWGLGLGRLSHGVVIGLQSVTVLSVVSLVVAVRRHKMDWITATGWAIVALLVTSTFLLPWYVVWLLPFAALSDNRALRRTCIALTAIGMTSL